MKRVDPPNSRKPWTPEETKYLAVFYGIEPVEATARLLGRSVSAVRHQAMKMGYTKEQRVK